MQQHFPVDIISPSELFRKDPQAYIASLTKMERRIFFAVWNFRKCKRVRIRNKIIADIADCDVRTVTRATTKFMADGLILKTQMGTYTPNDYLFSPLLKKGKAAFMVFLLFLPAPLQALYNLHGHIPKQRHSMAALEADVQHNCSSFVVESNLSSNNEYESLKGSTIRIRSQEKDKKLHDRENIMGEASELKGVMLSPVMKRIVSAFDLGLYDTLTLFAFPEIVLSEVYFYYQSNMKGKRGFAWFLQGCKAACATKKIPVGWKRFFQLCNDHGLDPKVEQQRKLQDPKRDENNQGYKNSYENRPSETKRIERRQYQPPAEKELSVLEKDLNGYLEIVAAAAGKKLDGMEEALLGIAKNAIVRLKEEIAERNAAQPSKE